MWTTPKTNWQKKRKAITVADLNRMEANILYLYEKVLV